MTELTTWLKGRKSNLVAVAMITFAIAALVNHWTNEEIAVLAGGMGAAIATLRAAIAKSGPLVVGATAKRTARVLVFALVVGSVVGCAALGQKGPDGTSPADNILGSVSAIAPMLPPPWNLIAPLLVGGVLTTVVAVGNASEPE